MTLRLRGKHHPCVIGVITSGNLGCKVCGFEPRDLAMSTGQFQVVFVLGPPGAGKGTVCQLIQERCGFRHISAGEILRQEMKKDNSELKSIIEGYVRVAALVPGNIMARMLLQSMETEGSTRYVVDGFPRDLQLLYHWDNVVGDRATVLHLIALTCSEEVCMARCLSRGQTSGRVDDIEKTLAKRFKDHFKPSTEEVYNHFRQKNMLMEINSDRAPDEVFEDARRLLESFQDTP